MPLNNRPPPQAQAKNASLWFDYQQQSINRLKLPRIAPTIHVIGASSLDVTTTLRAKYEAVRARLIINPRK